MVGQTLVVNRELAFTCSRQTIHSLSASLAGAAAVSLERAGRATSARAIDNARTRLSHPMIVVCVERSVQYRNFAGIASVDPLDVGNSVDCLWIVDNRRFGSDIRGDSFRRTVNRNESWLESATRPLL